MTRIIVDRCHRCRMPASLRCSVCGLTVCTSCLDADERMCLDCAHLASNPSSPPVGHPFSRKVGPKHHARR